MRVSHSYALSRASFARSAAIAVITFSTGCASLPFSDASNKAIVGPTIDWDELTVSVVSKKKRSTIIKEMHGRAEAGRLVAIMGPSGSGKSTLLKAVGGRLIGKNVEAFGRVTANGNSLDHWPVAFIEQQELFYEYSTVRETLMFAARLKLPDLTKEAQAQRVETALAKTGLSKAAHTLVSSCSGGERRRLAVARALIDNPSVVFADEPTSGLDSFAAERVVKTLKTLATEGRTVLCVIHQPSAAVFDLFDDLILLSEGESMYCGPINRLEAHLARLGLRRPRSASLAEHAVASVAVDFETPAMEKQSRLRRAKLAANALQPPRSHAVASLPESRNATRAPSLLDQFSLLFARAWRDVARAKGANAIKLAQQLATGLIYGGIYSLDDTRATIQDRFGLLSLAVIGSTNLAIVSSQKVFSAEKQIVQKEHTLYGALPYLLSKIAAEFPLLSTLSAIFGCVVYPLTGLRRNLKRFAIFLGLNTLTTLASSAIGLLLGAIAPSPDAALAFFPAIIVLNVVFNGINLNVDNIPKVIRWLPACSIVRWGFQGLAINEFDGLNFKGASRKSPGPPGFSAGAISGRQALERINLADASIASAVTSQAIILGSCYLQTYRTLRNSKPRYVQIRPPPRKLETKPNLAFFS